jgi:hypothetical protein
MTHTSILQLFPVFVFNFIFAGHQTHPDDSHRQDEFAVLPFLSGTVKFQRRLVSPLR